jgi:murein DD-endopeptidase / murein LD-carboxypeptidase
MAAIDAKRALALLGVPFRPQGRDPAIGLDCAGLCLNAYSLPERLGRCDYRLRGHHATEVIAALAGRFGRISPRQKRPGDLLLLSVAEDQLHLAICTEQGFVHADARQRRVVHTPGEPDWAIIGVYRRRLTRRAAM